MLDDIIKNQEQFFFQFWIIYDSLSHLKYQIKCYVHFKQIFGSRSKRKKQEGKNLSQLLFQGDVGKPKYCADVFIIFFEQIRRAKFTSPEGTGRKTHNLSKMQGIKQVIHGKRKIFLTMTDDTFFQLPDHQSDTFALFMHSRTMRICNFYSEGLLSC